MNQAQATQSTQGFGVSAVTLPGQASIDDTEIGAFDHFSMPTQLAIGAGIVGIGGAAGYAAYGLGSSMLGGGAVAAEGATAAGFTGLIVTALPILGGLLAAGAVSYGVYKVAERLVGGKTSVTPAKARAALANTDIDPALVQAVADELAKATVAKANKKAAKAAKKAAAGAATPALA